MSTAARHFTIAAIPLAVLSALATIPMGCDSGSSLPTPLGCRRASECADGLACSFNHCIAPEPNPLELKVRVTPPPPTGLLPQQIPQLSLASGPDLLVRLIGPATLRGGVRFSGDAFSVNVPGTITLDTAGDIPGLDFTFTAPSLSGVDREGYGYTIQVLPGRRYVGTFRPEDPSLPRHAFSVSADEVASGRFDVLLPAKADYRRVRGRVMRADYVPIPFARVVLLTPAREVIGVTATDEPRGLFDLLVPPTVSEVLVKVESTVSSPVFPEFVQGPFTLGGEAPLDLVVPSLAAGTEAVNAVLRVLERRADAPDGSSPDGQDLVPAVGRAVTIVGIFDGGTLRRNGTTNEHGEVTFALLPGAYECLVASPPRSAAASWHGHINLGLQLAADLTPVTEIVLSPRPPLIGRVTDSFGNPIEWGRLTFERRVTWREGSSLVIAPPPFEVELGADGLYSTRVDPGVYDLTVAPDLATGAPHTFETGILVGPEGLRFDLELPPPGLLHLTVASPDGAWLPGVRVELWADDEAQTPRLFALGTTGERGFVDLLVPHVGTTGLKALGAALEDTGEAL